MQPLGDTFITDGRLRSRGRRKQRHVADARVLSQMRVQRLARALANRRDEEEALLIRLGGPTDRTMGIVFGQVFVHAGSRERGAYPALSEQDVTRAERPRHGCQVANKS